MKGRTPIERKNENPGPGQYNLNNDSMKDRVRTTSVMNSQRFKSTKEKNSPGPGNYYKDEYFARNASPISI